MLFRSSFTMKFKMLFCLLTLLYAVQGICTALPTQFQFRHYNIENGMSSNSVTDIIQDRKGYIWMATDGGLNCFDGISFTFYQKGNPHYPTLQTNIIHTLCEAGEDTLWLGTDIGIYIYNRKEDCITRFDRTTENGTSVLSYINQMRRDRKGRIWIATREQDVFCYDPRSEKLKNYKLPDGDGTALCLLCDSQGKIWLSGYNHLYRLNEEKETFDIFPLENKENGFHAMAMWEDAVGSLWAGTWTEGLWKINPSTGETQKYLMSGGSRSAVHIHSIGEYKPDLLLIGSDNGMTFFKPSTGESQLYAHYGEETESLSDKFIYPILKDREGGMWIGTFYNGVNYLPPYSGQFEGYTPDDNSPLFCGKIISRFCEDGEGNIWIASDDGGLSCFSPQKRAFTDFAGREAFAYDNIHALCEAGDELWIGTYGQNIRILNRKTGSIKSYEGKEPNGVSVYTIFKDSRGRIWTGSMDALCLYDRKNDRLVPVETVESLIIDINEDTAGYLWIATGKGLFRHDPDKMTWKKYGQKEGLGTQIINHLCKDREGKLWVGTDEGLYLYDNRTDTLARQPLNIPNEYINAIVEGDSCLWITTAKGLVKYTPGTKAAQVFTRSDGLQSEAFISASALRARNGDIYVGSINGFNRFNPHQLKQNSLKPTVVLTGLEIFNQPIETEADGILPLSIDCLDEIHLSHADNVITLQYAALSYCTPQKNQYAYMLEGFDKEWNYVGSQNSTTYTNLPAGTYTFRVKASNNDNIWNEEGTSIRIIIHPPFYLSLPFKVAYVLLFFLALGILVHSIIKRSEKKHAKVIDELNIRKEKEMHEAKINFFTMIAHEIRTPVSLIIGPLEKVMQSTSQIPAEIRNDLEIIDRNSQRLLYLVNQLLDFRKVEQNEMKMHFASQSIKELMKAVCERFQPSLEQKGIALSVVYPEDGFYADVDREAVTKVLSNLLTNANKYTKDDVRIEFAAQTQQQTFSISVTDNGKGMNPKELQLIFQPFYQGSDNKPGTGIGLSIVKGIVEAHHGQIEVKSQEAKGSSFRIILPIRQKDAKPAENTHQKTTKLPEDILPEQISNLNAKKLPVILIAEDNEDMMHFLSESFKSSYTVIQANDGREALEHLKGQDVALIISDWMMPNMDGIELCKAVRNDPLTSHIPFILLTAKTDNDSKISGMNCGADAYIEKPFSLQYLSACIKNLLDLREQLYKKFSQMPTVPISSIAGNSADKEFLIKMNQLIEDNFDNTELSVDFLAEQLCISRSGLFAKIKALANITPNEMIQLIRLKKAATLLLENKYHISEVSYMVGFNNPSYFSKCFQKQFGVTPGKFVENNTEKK